MEIVRFNIRIYGVMINDNNEVLVADEERHGQRFTKFPGGGLEFGEGIKDCLQREFNEELDMQIEVGEVIYVTDYFQVSAFDARHQLISIYYKVIAQEAMKVSVSNIPFNFTEEKDEMIAFRWIALKDLTADMMTFPVDKIVAEKINSPT